MGKLWLTRLMKVTSLLVLVVSALGFVATLLNAFDLVPFYTSSDWFTGMLLAGILYQLCCLHEARS
jgi:cytosine/uracil/thiamine/allantoin permease